MTGWSDLTVLIEVYKHYPKRNQNSKYGVINLSDNLNSNPKYKDKKYALDLRKGNYENYKTIPSKSTQNDLNKEESGTVKNKTINFNSKIEKSSYLKNDFKTKFSPKVSTKTSYLKYWDKNKKKEQSKLSFKLNSNQQKTQTIENDRNLLKTEMNFMALAKEKRNYDSHTSSKQTVLSPKHRIVQESKK